MAEIIVDTVNTEEGELQKHVIKEDISQSGS